jgi:hypothetical protein
MDVYYKAELVNICGYPVHITASGQDISDSVDTFLNSEESAIVMHYGCLDSRGLFTGLFTIEGSRYAIGSLLSCIHSDYKMTISANGKEQNVDVERMLKILEKADYSHSTYFYEWIIRDSSLCP